MADPHSSKVKCRRPPFELGFTKVNGPVPPESSISEVVEEPALKRRKASVTTREKQPSTVPRLKRTSSKLMAKVTKPRRETSIQRKGSNVEQVCTASHTPSEQHLALDLDGHPPPLPQAMKKRLEAFRYAEPPQDGEQCAAHTRLQQHPVKQIGELLPVPRREQLAQIPVYQRQGSKEHLEASRTIGLPLQIVSEAQELPPSHQSQNQQYPSSCGPVKAPDSFIEVQDYPIGTEDHETIAYQEEQQFPDPSWSDQLFQSSPSNETASKQPFSNPALLPTERNALQQCETLEEDFDIMEDDEEIAALIALTDSASASASPTRSSCAFSPPKVLVQSTITTIPESPPTLSHSRSTNIASPSRPQIPNKPVPFVPSTILAVNNSSLETQISPTPSTPRPFIRGAHPKPALARSLIPGLSPSDRVLTCFRLGEAINASSRAQRDHHPIQVEVFLQVLSSTRRGNVQHFRFADLWHTISSRTGLVIEGEWRCWSGVKQWEIDAEGFLEAGSNTNGEANNDKQSQIARVIGGMERKANGAWYIEVGTCWEVLWDEVENVRSIVCS